MVCELKREVFIRMDLMTNKVEMRLLATIVICSTLLISSCVYIFMSTPQKNEIFQAWILGTDGIILGPVLNVSSNQNYELVLGVQNSMGTNESCKVTTEFRSVPHSDNSTSANATAIASVQLREQQFFLTDNQTWATTINFRINGEIEDNLFRVQEIELDGTKFQINLTSSFDAKRVGYFWQFRFELWALNNTSNDYYFTNVWVSSPFLNMTQ